MTQPPTPEWSTRLALSIAQEVRRHRQAQGLSAQQLSDRCTELGMPIQRSVLANLESGRRTTVTVAEVLVLATALNIPPGLLLFPVGYAEVVEFLPGRQVDTLDAVDWLSGGKPLPSGISLRKSALHLYRRHRALERDLHDLIDKRNALRARYAVDEGRVAEEHAHHRLHEARSVYVQATAVAEAAAERLKVATAAGDASPAVRTDLLEAEIRATDALLNLQQAEAEVSRTSFMRNHLESLDALIADRAMDLEKVRIDMCDSGYILPVMSDDLVEAISDLPRDGTLDVSIEDLTDRKKE
ncbi:helix-turn-helix domain-containing protein [Streptomyces acidiscabies]|uniref:helix-turn-helix domain-containing protein n=1 Tax=Streptomyces acidiscabies TaxID=42234 RepID=UPI000952B97C|nr:helix-turn-helix transcriptional regulator [Streptomyces acidiscabies]